MVWRGAEVPFDKYKPLTVPMTAAAILFAVACFILALVTHEALGVKKVMLAVWTVGIPTFFFFEWMILRSEDTAEQAYKDGNEKTQKAWLAVAACLSLLYVGDVYKAEVKDDTKEKIDRAQADVKTLHQAVAVLNGRVNELTKK